MVVMGTQFSITFVIAVFMVRRFEGAGASEQTVGRHSGFLVRKTLSKVETL